MLTTFFSQVPPGSQDLLAEEVRRRRRVQREWFDLAEAWGYQEVIPPTFEYEEVFTRGGGAELARRLIRFIDRDGRALALRADFTSSLARMAASKLFHAPLPLRLCYAGKVYRQEPEGGGRRRELFQLGAELIGEPDVRADLEILRLVIATLRALEFTDFQLNVGDIRFIAPIVSGVLPTDAERLRNAIDRRDRRSLEAAADELKLPAEWARVLRALPGLIGRGEMLQRAHALASDEATRGAIARLAELDRQLTEEERTHVVYDLGEVRGLGYYTGMQFEVFLAGVGRAVGFGGRYDELLALYGAERPAVGFALEMDAIADVLGGRA